MKKHASALAIAALLAAPAAHSAVAVDFNGEFEANAVNLDNDAPGQEDGRGILQLLRLGANIKLDDGVQIVTRMNLSNRQWSGDRSNIDIDIDGDDYAYSIDGAYSPDAADNVTLDLGYLQLPLGPGILRIGRQESNWGNCFVSCDDRRDRIQYVTRLGGTNIGLGYDKRVEGEFGPGPDADDDQTGYYGFAVGQLGPVVAGLLIYHLRYDDNAATPMRDGTVTLVSPYFQTKVAGIDLSGTFAYQNMDPGQGSMDDRLGAYLRAGYDFGVAKVEGQLVWTDGYTPNQGFDSFSSMINNSPENKNSALSVENIGADTIGFAARVYGNVTEQLKLVAAAGVYDDGDADERGYWGRDVKLTFFDLQAHYQVTPSTLIWATAGRVNVDPASGSDTDLTGLSLNVRTTF